MSAPPSAPTTRIDAWLADRRRLVLSVAAVVGLAVILRVVQVLEMRASPNFAAPVLDARYHVDWARALAAGEEFHPGPFFRAPLYPWFLAAVFTVFGPGLLVPRLLQAGFGAATVVLVYLLGARAFGRATGLLAALFTALHGTLVYFDGQLLIPTLILPLDLLALWLTMRAADRGGWRPLVAAGLAWGTSAIARPNVLLFMPLLAGWLLVTRRPLGRGLGAAAVLAAATLLPILPITAYNTLVQGDPVLISTQAGVNFWIGNNPWSDGGTAIVPGTRAGWWDGYRDSIAQAEQEAGHELSGSGVSRHYAAKAWRFVFTEPAHALQLLGRKLRLFWLDRELGNNEDMDFFVDRFAPATAWLPRGFGLVAGLGLVGIFWSGLRHRRRFVLWTFVLVYMASVVAFFVNARFRLPVVPVLLVFAAHTVLRLADAVRAGRWRSFAIAAAAVAGVWLASRQDPAGLVTDDSVGLMQLGFAESARGNHREAVLLLREALAKQPANHLARIKLAQELDRSGDFAAAERELQTVLSVPGYPPDALAALLELYLDHRRIRAGSDLAVRARATLPDADLPAYYLGRFTELERGPAAAIPFYREALDRAPRSFAAAAALARALDAGGDPAAARTAWQRAVANRADGAAAAVAEAITRLAALLRAAGEADAAAAVERLRRAPGR